MYTLLQLLLRNTLIGIVFCSAIVGVSLWSLSTDLMLKQSKHQILINAIAQATFNDNNVDNFTKILQGVSRYTFLSIDEKSKENLYKYSSKPAGVLLPLTQIKINQTSINIEASPTREAKNLIINYQLDFSDESNLILKIIMALTLTTFLLVIIASFSGMSRNKILLATINKQLINEFSSDTEDESQNSTSNNFIDILGLRESINKVRQLIQSQKNASFILEKEAYIEPITQLGNRSRFVQYFENQKNSESAIKFGVLTITRCSELQTINQIHGYKEGDNYICNVANIMKSAIATYKGAQLFRLNSSDFATMLPNTTIKEAENFAQNLTAKFNEYQQKSDLDSVAYTGIVYFEQDRPLGELLALADTGISIAQTQNTNSWYAQTDTNVLESSSASYGNQNWRQEIDNVLSNQRVTLFVQSIQPSHRNSKMYGEILARFLNENNEMLPTASFIAMAEKLDKIVDIDKLIIETAITEISSKNLLDSSFGLNISTRSINDEHFLIWLERRLLRVPSTASKLIFEITEYGLQQNIKTSKRFIDMMHKVGSRVTVERFGVGLTSFKFFRELKPDFIKMDSIYTRDIDEDKNNQYFLRLMIDLAHRLSITVLAESVESQEEKFTLEKLFIDGCQGFYIGKPQPL